MKEFESLLTSLAKENDMQFRKCTTYHFQLKGVFLLNIYPTTGAVYVQGTNGKTKYSSLEELIDLANGDIELEGVDRGKRVPGRGRRKAIWDSGERFCFVCSKEFSDFSETTLEHKIPLSRGGSNRRDNLALSHYECNHERGNSLSIKKVDKI